MGERGKSRARRFFVIRHLRRPQGLMWRPCGSLLLLLLQEVAYLGQEFLLGAGLGGGGGFLLFLLVHELVDANEDTDFVKQIHLIETFKGAGFLSAVSLMGEIGDFSAFSKPKQLFAYFGLDPAVKQSGKFEGTKIQMSKRGSAIARRVIHTLTLQSISISRKGEAKNLVLRDYYLKKCESKPKLVAMGAVSHKICNIIFAILRDNKPFEIITPQEHIKQYNAAKCDVAA